MNNEKSDHATPGGEDRLDLAADFAPPGYEDWKKEAIALLKDAPFDRKMFTPTYEGITLKPIYNADDIQGSPVPGSFPGVPPYVRGTRPCGFAAEPWAVAPMTCLPDPSVLNTALRQGLESGETAINLCLARHGGADGKRPPGTLSEWLCALDGCDLSQTPVFIQSGAEAGAAAAMLAAVAEKKGLDGHRLAGCVECDPLGDLAETGRLDGSLAARYDIMADLAAWAAGTSPRLRTVAVRADRWPEAGANAVQEVAFAVATGTEYLREMTARGLGVNEAAGAIRFTFSVGPQFFLEIAKLRAARLVWSNVVLASGGGEAAARMVIHARVAGWNLSRLDPHTNILRATTEAFSAVAGGVDSLDTGLFDAPARTPGAFSRRISRNIQIILAEEARMAQVIDPAGGSWYVESLTLELAAKVWELFREIERRGGMGAALQEGYPQAETEAVFRKRVENVDRRKDTLLGVNMYPNLDETPLRDEDAEPWEAVAEPCTDPAGPGTDAVPILRGDPPPTGPDRVRAAAAAAAAGACIDSLSRWFFPEKGEPLTVTPVRPRRLAEGFEALRHAAGAWLEKTGRRPTVFLANLGPLTQHRARAEFAAGFFQAGGFDVINPKGFPTPGEAAKAAVESGASVAVLCSTDDTYPELVPPFVEAARASRPELIVVLAGYPEAQVDAHRKAGVDEFIHLRANCRAVLESIMKRTGVLS